MQKVPQSPKVPSSSKKPLHKESPIKLPQLNKGANQNNPNGKNGVPVLPMATLASQYNTLDVTVNNSFSTQRQQDRYKSRHNSHTIANVTISAAAQQQA